MIHESENPRIACKNLKSRAERFHHFHFKGHGISQCTARRAKLPSLTNACLCVTLAAFILFALYFALDATRVKGMTRRSLRCLNQLFHRD